MSDYQFSSDKLARILHLITQFLSSWSQEHTECDDTSNYDIYDRLLMPLTQNNLDTDLTTFILNMNNLKDSLTYAPPEGCVQLWDKFGLYASNYLVDSKDDIAVKYLEPFVKKAVRATSNEEIDDLYKDIMTIDKLQVTILKKDN